MGGKRLKVEQKPAQQPQELQNLSMSGRLVSNDAHKKLFSLEDNEAQKEGASA